MKTQQALIGHIHEQRASISDTLLLLQVQEGANILLQMHFGFDLIEVRI